MLHVTNQTDTQNIRSMWVARARVCARVCRSERARGGGVMYVRSHGNYKC